MKKERIKHIFKDHWESFAERYNPRIRKNVFREVERMLGCGSLENGYIEYKCEDCGEIKRIGFTCKSRFCTSCGKIYIDDWVEELTGRLINCKHRHMVFTIPDILRTFFMKKRKRLSILTRCSAEVLKSWLKERSKKEEYTPGIVSVIHTFGRDLKWNPHVHVLITEGAVGKETEWKKINYFPYKMLRKRWQKLLLDEIEKEIGKRKGKKLKDEMYKKYPDGFYVYGKGEIKSAKGAAKYVGRYTGRPAISESRITDYDGEYVTFYYERHEDGKRIEEKVHAHEFIRRVIVHIPEKRFNMVRYYGIYSRNNKNKKRIPDFKLLDEKVLEQLRKLRTWKYRIMKAFGIDPLKCEKCKGKLVMNDIYYKKYGSMLERYRQRSLREVNKEIEKLNNMYHSIKKVTNGEIEPLFI
jgi:hypothetical protein